MKQKVKTKLPKNKRQPIKEVKIYNNIVFHNLDWLEWCTIAVGLLFVFAPDIVGYKFLFSVLLVTPILGLMLNGINRPSIISLVEIDLRNNKYDVADFIDWAAWCITIRVILDFNIDSISYLIIPGLIATISIIILLFLTHKMIIGLKKSKAWIYFSIIFNLFVYSYAATYGVNCVYDNSVPEKYTSVIMQKYTSSRKRGTNYNIEFISWEDNSKLKKERIPESIYNEINIGDNIEIYRKKGLIGIPWWHINRIGYTE